MSLPQILIPPAEPPLSLENAKTTHQFFWFSISNHVTTRTCLTPSLSTFPEKKDLIWIAYQSPSPTSAFLSPEMHLNKLLFVCKIFSGEQKKLKEIEQSFEDFEKKLENFLKCKKPNTDTKLRNIIFDQIIRYVW